MAYDESLAARIREVLDRQSGIEEKKMFGGVGFLLNGNMLVGVWKENLVVRIGPDAYEGALTEPSVVEFDITGRPMKGFVFVDAPGTRTTTQVKRWVDLGLTFARSLPPK